MCKLLIFLLLPIMLFSQKQKIQGTVVSAHNEKLSFVAVEVFDAQNLLIKKLITDENGAFSIDDISEASITLVFKDLEYDQLEEKIDLSLEEKPLWIVLKKNVQDIEGILLVKQKPVIIRKIDRLTFNVQNSNISALNAWEILKKTPGVTVNNEALTIKGSQHILVTINDKKVMLTGDELKNLLENTQGKDLKSIEVITNPPAKYEASGSAVLNLVMKKNTLEGYRGIISSKYVQSQYAKGAVGISQYYKKDRLSVTGSYYFGGGTYYRQGTDYVNYIEDETRWISTMNRKDKNKSQNTVNLNVEYELDSLINLSFNYGGFFSPKSSGIYHVPTLIYNNQNVVESYYTTINDHYSRSINNALSFQVDRTFKNKSKISWTTYFAGNNTQKHQNVLTYLDFINQNPTENNFITNNKSDVQLYSTQADYDWKNEKWEVESGAKYSFVRTSSVLSFSEKENGDLQFQPDKSNTFEYQEHNFALYSSLTYNPGKWNFKAGLRAEKTNLEGKVSAPFEINKNDYWKLFPTLYTQYTTTTNHQFGLSYGKRISRPSYSWLNPAKSYYNLFSYFQGDPTLQATIIHNLNFTYTYKDWNLDVYYRKEVNPSMEISFQEPATKNLIYYFTNIEKGQAYGLGLYKNFQIKPWWSLSISENLEHNENYFVGVEGILHQNKVWNWSSDISTSFTLDKKSDWTLDVGHQYHSPSIQGTFTISGSSSTYLVMNRKFFGKKLEASLFFNDIFKTSQQKVSTKYANQDNYFLDYRDAQNFIISLKFNFGNQKVKDAKTIKTAAEQERM